MAHWVSLLAYYPEVLWHDPMQMLRINASLSSSGGLLGAALGAVSYWTLFGHHTGLSLRSYGDVVTVGWTAGWLFGRLGCTLAHDHPGLPSAFALAVQFPDGPRHDLGVYKWLYTLGLNVFVFSIRGRQLPPGTILGLGSMTYAAERFLLDFLRVEDARYAGLTPGQYFSVALLAFGFWIVASMQGKSAAPKASPLAQTVVGGGHQRRRRTAVRGRR
jgi:phosphatidylglycerol:prolipoprotein diacylglycerol transferase